MERAETTSGLTVVMHTSAFSPSFIGGVPALVAHTRDFVCFCLVPGSVRLRLNAYIPKFSVYESSSCRCALKQFSKDCVDRESSPTFLNHEQKHQLIIACNVLAAQELFFTLKAETDYKRSKQFVFLNARKRKTYCSR